MPASVAFLGAVAIILFLPPSRTQPAPSLSAAELPPPVADYHLHIQSKALSEVLEHVLAQHKDLFAGMSPALFNPRSGADALRVLNKAGIRNGVLLSEAYMFTSPFFDLHNIDKERLTREENAFDVAQAAQSGGRLVAFISVNPLSPTATREIAYWKRTGGASGIKLHLANSGFDFGRPTDIEALRRVFSEAYRDKFPIIIHLRNRQGYGAAQANTFINEILPSAGNVPVQIAHGGGWGGLDDETIASLSVFSQAIAAHRPGTERLTFDLALVVLDEHTDPGRAQHFVDLMRKIGIERFAMGSDWPAVYTPSEYADLVERQLPLKPEEWRVILSHRADYLAKSSTAHRVAAKRAPPALTYCIMKGKKTTNSSGQTRRPGDALRSYGGAVL
jgi:predicted TIM-barrel fold metal-dependent hydrolase